MKSYSSYNKKGDKKRSGLLWASLAILLILFFMESGGASDWQNRLTKKVNKDNETSFSEEIVKIDDLVLEVHFLDVGHGDATLIICGEHAMMIDCGDETQGAKLRDYMVDHGVSALDYLVLTHPDKDHIGGAPVILTEFPIGQIFRSDYIKGSRTEEELQQALIQKEAEAVMPVPGTEYQLGEAWFTILGPERIYEESNDSSIVLLLHFGVNTFLFTGDAEKDAEQDMVENSGKPGLSLKADVYQVGHHGDKSSSKKKFLSAVSPEFAVISCDYQGEKGHPDAEVLNRLREAGVKVFRTDEQGTIVAVSDGRSITWNCAPSESWQAGE